ncbi:dermonecrotic toxin domain-containing protein [Sodalis sp. RH21]|uniref:dermonecrotic toxin domain-containing protein n=1 Tax=unclassified Sodalis (in: enterobacteria) TaxID=2636512 RepID=UPI0039B36B47
MPIIVGENRNAYISDDHCQDVFFDCAEQVAWPEPEYHDCIDIIDNTATQPISLSEDIQRSLFHLLKIAVGYEANRFCNEMLYKTGLTIPLCVLNTSAALYRAITLGNGVGSVLAAGLPLFIHDILPYTDRLQGLANQIKDYFEQHLSVALMNTLTNNQIEHGQGYLWLGILALVSKYFCDSRPHPLPERGYLSLPPILAGLFTRACLYWQLLCNAAGNMPQPVDGHGRLKLDLLEKNRQLQGRYLARNWAKRSRHNQSWVERAAERYYGIGQITGRGGVSGGNGGLIRPLYAPAAQHGPGYCTPPGEVVPIPASRRRWLPLDLCLLPAAQAAPVDLPAGADGRKTLATAYIPRRDASIPLNNEWLNRYLHHAFPIVSPSVPAATAGQQEPIAAYTRALDGYWQHNHEYHRLGTLLNVLTQLYAARDVLTERSTITLSRHLGLDIGSADRSTLHLFDINGYQATDLLVFNLTHNENYILFLPHATVHFRVFDGLPALRQWIIDHCANETGREEIARHFALNERMDGSTLLGKWGVDRWLTHIYEYPGRIFQRNEPLTQDWQDILTNRQRSRCASDAEWLTPSGAAALRQTGKTTIYHAATLFAQPLVPYIAPRLAINHGIIDANATMGEACGPGAGHSALGCALTLLSATLGEMLPRDAAGDLVSTAAARPDIAGYIQIVNHEIALWQAMSPPTAVEMRILAPLAVTPEGYKRQTFIWPQDKLHTHLSISLTLANGRRKAEVMAIRIHYALVPLRYNDRLKLYEIYDINHSHRPGYPVYIAPPPDNGQWRFGRATDERHIRHRHGEIPMANYDFVSVRLFNLIMNNLDSLCCKVKALSPINSLGIAQSPAGRAYLKLGTHYINIKKLAGGNIYLLGTPERFHLRVALERKIQKFVLLPENSIAAAIPAITIAAGINATLGYRQGFRHSDEEQCRRALAADEIMRKAGVRDIIYYGLTPLETQNNTSHMVLALTVKTALATTAHLLRDLLYSTGRAEQSRLTQTVYSSLKLHGASDKLRQKTLRLINQGMEKMLALIDSHTADEFSRLWLAAFRQEDIDILAIKTDPLARIMIHSRSGDRAGGKPAKREIRFCRFACHEIPDDGGIAALGTATGRIDTLAPGSDTPQDEGEDFPAAFGRLWNGKMTQNEVNFLIGQPQVHKINNSPLLTDRELARQLFRHRAVPRIAMIVEHADLFSLLLLHLHRTVNAERGDSQHDRWVKTLLFATAFQSNRA